GFTHVKPRRGVRLLHAASPNDTYVILRGISMSSRGLRKRDGPPLPLHMRETLGRKLHQARAAKGLRLEDVAGQLRISTGYLSQLERALEPSPRMGVILALQDLYDIPSLELLLGDFPSK